MKLDLPMGGATRALHDMDATSMAAAFRNGALSPVEVTRAVLDRIGHWEPQLLATYLLRPEVALAQARASEERWRAGKPMSDLDGVPVTIKENISTAGDPVPLGTAATTLVPAAQDAPPAARLREAGCVIIAKTTMPDYGMLSSGLSSFHPLTRNPWDVALGPGGSSSGAAAACAGGYGPLHLGTDIGGSLRLPAGWCGVFSLKPSLGRVPIDPPAQGRVAGPITRSVLDAALMMRPLCGPDSRDTMSLPPAVIDWASVAEVRPELLKGLRLGLLMDAGCGLPVETSVREAVEAAAALLEKAGAIVEPMAPFMTQAMLDGMDHTWRMRSHLDMAGLPAERRAKVLPYLRTWADSVADISGASLYHAQRQFYATRVATLRACAAFDYVISPVAPMPAFDAELPSPTDDPLHPLEHIGFTVPFNMSEQPAASVPCGFTPQGLPVGLQIAGPRFDDLGVLKVARAFELIRQPMRAWPEPERA
ncbi:amidase [Xylophilus sp. GOD-11R]|uniref:amidase n=1 Tax=Xylophilus sp. GOD-11R TaxID=3089814 RepID=UPI00298CC75B|nr:amidase [Xylophilus sp. GOD-11R]WPB57871.1 amidase [Xylophilus sp. GOD-11R]